MNRSGPVDRKRRRLVLGMGGLAALPAMPALAAPPQDAARHADRLWYRQSAARWEEALPLGNGRLGAMVFGRVGQERLQLNEDTLWAGAPYSPDNPDALAALPPVRALLAQGKYEEATELANARMMAKPVRQMSYGTLGDLLLTMADAQAPSEYERSLDLAGALAHTRYRTAQGVYLREAFVSAPDQVMVLHLKAPKGRLGFELAWRAPRKVKYAASNDPGLATDLAAAAPTDWLQREDAGAVPPGAGIVADGPGALLVTGLNEAMHGIAAGLRYAMRVQVVSQGVPALRGRPSQPSGRERGNSAHRRGDQLCESPRCWVAHHNTDLWRAAAPIDGAKFGMWPCGGAWLCNTLWDHADYSRDQAVLQRLYPVLRGAAQFFLDTLVEDPQGRGLITSPSLSPENNHAYGSSLAAGPAMDRQIVRDLFSHTLAAGRMLGQDDALLAQIAAARARLAPDRIGAQGQLQEWLEDWDAGARDPHHRHVSHLYAVYPSSQINVRDTPDLVRAARTSLTQRGDFATGWGTAWRVCLWARMGDAEHAYSVLKGLTGPMRTYPNMFDAHPPFQIDGNFGGAAGIMEMLLQSWGGEVLLLPALPAAWPTGSVRGIRARGGLRIDLDWRAGRLTKLRIGGRPGARVALRYRGKLLEVTLGPDGSYTGKGALLGAA